MVEFTSKHSINTLAATIQGFIYKIYNYNTEIEEINDQLHNLLTKLNKKNYPKSIFETQLNMVKGGLFIDNKNAKIKGKIKCNTNECKYCQTISNNTIIHCNLHQNLLITQNYNCQIDNFTFIAHCLIFHLTWL